MKRSIQFAGAILLAISVLGCTSNKTTPAGGGGGTGGPVVKGEADKPAFTLAWSEYPSWSVFGVADEYKLINGKQGQMATIELKWGVDIVLKEAAYDTCLNLYSSKDCDAVCVTNMDALNPALSRSSVAIMPTSTSFGADACIVTGIKDLDELKSHKVYGLKGTVSEYCFVRNLELANKKEADYTFENMDPAAAAVAMQNKNPEQKAIMVWNPFVLQTLKTRSDATVLFDSTKIPGEIVDMVVVAEESLKKPGGKEFALAVIDTFYELSKLLDDPKEGDKAVVALGEKFSSLDKDEMRKALEQTRFYTLEKGLDLLTDKPDDAGKKFSQTMDQVVKFCVDHQIVREQPKVGLGKSEQAPGVHLRMDPSYLQEYQAKK